MGLIQGYTRWLHTQWPAGHVEKLPICREDGSTNVPGLYIVGDLTGIPLLKFAVDKGARAVQTIVGDPAFARRDKIKHHNGNRVLDLVIVGAGVSGMAAALEARKHKLDFEILEASEPFSTVVNFPKGKPIYTYPQDMVPTGQLRFSERSKVKEGLVEELRAQTLQAGITPRIARVDRVVRHGRLLQVVVPQGEGLLAHRVIVGIGRSGNFHKLGVPGEDLDKVYNRLHDPKDFTGQNVLVVGGGDSALETAIATAQCGANVVVSYRKAQFSRPKPQNVDKLNALRADPMADVQVEEPSSERVTTAVGGFTAGARRPGSIRLMMSSRVKEIRPQHAVITNEKGLDETLSNDAVFVMIGRQPPLDFFRRCGVRIHGQWRPATWVGLLLFMAFCVFLYHWKADLGLPIQAWFKQRLWFPFNLTAPSDPASFLGTIRLSMLSPSFYYSLAYCAAVGGFGIARIRRRRTPYVTTQTLTLMAIQLVPLFLLPYVLLPWAGHNGWFDSGVGKALADALFPLTPWGAHGREYWRSVGFILAWPLMVWNVFTSQPLWAWLVIGVFQTFVLIPLMIYFWGKGAYCGWVCSCGALAETMGDAHRHKMPHGPIWNRLNMLGQVFLLLASVLLIARVVAWFAPQGSAWGRAAEAVFMVGLYGKDTGGQTLPFPWNYLSYTWFVDLLWAGILGLGLYFWFSGRVWCRFACPLAALMHIYARFSRFRILADKKKCISCNVCTSVCHQGIDVMNFANKGLPMADPQCVRCSACVQSCPTGVLTFGQIDRASGKTLRTDRLAALPVAMTELSVKGQRLGGGKR
jgi:thioredoxin reductase/polyferredoxin